MAKIYALYKGETNIMDGTAEEIAKYLKTNKKTVWFLASKAYLKRRKQNGNSHVCVLIGKE